MRFLLFLTFFILSFSSNSHALVAPQSNNLHSNFTIHNNHFYLNGKPFFINAVGYAPWRPEQLPGTDQVGKDIIDYDFKLIKAAGFNTIRTWEVLSPRDLKLAKKHGLYVIQGIWIDPKHDFSDKQWQEFQLAKIHDAVEATKPFDNVLFYMIITEPTTQAVAYAGKSHVNDFFHRIRATVRSIDPRPVSMDSWFPLGFLDYSIWDITTINLFMFVPESLNKTIDFENIVRFYKNNYAKNKPLFIGETGGYSVSSVAKNDIGYGGNTEQQQADGDIESIKHAIKAGAAGVATVCWIDTWYYPKHPLFHDQDEPWKWDGILGIEKLGEPLGRLRQVYFKLKNYFLNGLNADFDHALNSPPNQPANAQIQIIPSKSIFNINDIVAVQVMATVNGKPAANKEIKYGFFEEKNWQEIEGETQTDDNGIAAISSPLPVENDTGYELAFASLKDFPQAYDLKFMQINLNKGDSKYFYIYKDRFSPLNHYVPSGWIGDWKQLTLDDDINKPTSGDTCIRISYKPSLDKTSYSGLYWQNPLNNWGTVKGGYNLTGKKALTFWARGEVGGERISQFVTGAVQVNKFQDSSTSWLTNVTLTKEWKQYKIDLIGKDLSSISGGFGIVLLASENPHSITFYLDDIRFE